MSNLALPMLYALLLWWFSTGVILYLDGLPRRSFRYSLAGAGVVAVGALALLVRTAGTAASGCAYLGFTCAVLVWGWIEMAYFMGVVTGPSRAPCPPGVHGWGRFVRALRTSLYHEAAVVVTAATLFVITRDEPNALAAQTFVVLWLMRWSSKLNVFLGVPNLNVEFLPESLEYLKSYMPQRPMNLFFPLSVTVATLVTAHCLESALAAPAGSFEATADSLLAAILLLGVLEHWFLVLPLEDAALWRWALQVRRRHGALEAPLRAASGTAD